MSTNNIFFRRNKENINQQMQHVFGEKNEKYSSRYLSNM